MEWMIKLHNHCGVGVKEKKKKLMLNEASHILV